MYPKRFDRTWLAAGAAATLIPIAGLPVAGCASGQPPKAEIALATDAVSDAERAGAVEYAPVELNQARQRLSDAQAASRNEDYRAAARLAEEAVADAKLARLKTQASLAEKSAGAVQAGSNTLRQELTPQSGR
jgi:hypothetical protein